MTPTQPDNDGDGRSALRRRVLKPGKIVVNRRSTIDCTVHNMSARGAKLDVATVVGVPDVFELKVDGQLQPCRVVWRRLKELGVEFLSKPSSLRG